MLPHFMAMNQGKIIEYIDKGKFVCTFCIQDRGNRLHLLTASNREVNLSTKRAFLISGALINTLNPREELLKILKRTEELRMNLMEEVHVKEIWELIKDENESFDYKYLAQLCFGEIVTDDHISALVRALFEDRLYFRMKEERFLPNSEARVDQIVRQREEDALREEQLSQGGNWLKGVLRGENIPEPTHKKDIIKLLVELALYGKEAPEYQYGKDLLLRAEISDIEQARKLLVKLDAWEEDENLDLIRLDIRTSFTEKLLIEADQLSQLQIKSAGREDLRDFDVFTIDGPLTRDFDDALSLEMKGDTFHLGIHIADVAEIIPPYSPLDLEAFHRGASVYLPRRQIPMIPPRLSQDILSLKQDFDRAAISLISRFDKGGNLLDCRFIPSLIRVKRQLTYDEVNDLFIHESPFEEMYRLSRIMRQKRIDHGALILSLPDVSVEIETDSSISLKMIDQNTPSRMIVAEFMIFYNWMTARFCRDNNIPILYRGQEGPSERFPIDESDYIFYVFKQRRRLNPLRITLEPRPHTGLGLDAYTNVSSPIRRYLDLVAQNQIRNFLLNKSPVYNEEELEKIRVTIEPGLKGLDRVKRGRIRYWTQKYLLQHVGEKFSALILYALKNKYRVLLTDFLLIAEIRRENGQKLSGGQRIIVKVKKSDPWNDLLNLEYVDNSEIAQ